MILVAVSLASAADRVAVVIGSNAASPGAARLRYAERDATDVAEALIDVAHFDADAVHLLLEPDAPDVLAALEHAVHEADEMVLFYYSGHADSRAIYPGGSALALDQVRETLLASNVKLRVGIIDACSGGSWTGTKGLTPDSVPFALPDVTESEGAAWIASTSGSEEAHEAEVVGGSLFTHHLVVGLRGAADGSGEGAVSLWEAFEYAKRNTTRDAALYAGALQTPSFDLQIRGRRDLVLSEVDGAPSELQLSQAAGPLQVVQVDTGVMLLELERGQRAVRLALRPGLYVVRSPSVGGTVRSVEVLVRTGEVALVDEGDLDLHHVPLLAPKGARAVDLNALTLPARHADLRLRVPVVLSGAPFPGLGMSASWAASDRVELTLPGLVAFRGGNRAGTDWVAWGGVAELRQVYDYLAASSHAVVTTGTGVDVLRPIGRRSQLQVGLFANRALWLPAAVDGAGPTDLTFGGQIYWTYTLRDRVTFNVGVSLAGAVLEVDGETAVSDWLGFQLTRAGQRIPLVQWRATPTVALDLYLSEQWIAALDWTAPISAASRGLSSPYPVVLGATVSL